VVLSVEIDVEEVGVVDCKRRQDPSTSIPEDPLRQGQF
jgi:hypothetical protein